MAKKPSYKDFKPFEKDSGRTFTYKANSDGVNKELGPKVILPPKPINEGKSNTGDLSNLKNPSSGKNDTGDLSNLKNPSSGKNAIGDLSNFQNPSDGKKEIANLSSFRHPAQGKFEVKKLSSAHSNGVNKKPGAIKDKNTLPYQGVNKGPGAIKPKSDQPSHYGDWPLAKFSFVVNVGGLTGEMAFQGMDGLGASVGKMEFRDGNSSKFYKQTRPTLTSYDPVTLKKGMFVGDTKLFDWFKNVSQGSMFSDMRTVTITLCELVGNKPQHIFTWTLEKAYITKFTPSGLDGEADTEPAVEEIELTYQSFSMEAGEGGLLGSLMGAASGLLGTVTGALSGSISGSISF